MMKICNVFNVIVFLSLYFSSDDKVCSKTFNLIATNNFMLPSHTQSVNTPEH